MSNLMYLSNIFLFFIYCYGFGMWPKFLIKESEDFLEKHLVRIGIGLSSFLFFGFLLSVVRLPLDWRIFLIVSIFFIAFSIFYEVRRSKALSNVKIPKLNLYGLLMLALFFITLYMYVKGAFVYTYMEDEDPYSHVVGVKFVATEKTIFAGPKNVIRYIDPYPPAYDMFLGVMHQTNNSAYWTMKFFNALIISLTIIFFYFFIKNFTSSSKKAFYSTFALFAVPAFLSHFMWSIAMTMSLFFVAFYCMEKIRENKKWFIVASVVLVPTLTSSPTHSAYFAMFLGIYYLMKVFAEKKFLLHEAIAIAGGIALSFLLWWLPSIITHGVKGVLGGVGLYPDASIVSVGGTGDRVYKVSEFIFSNKVNAINNPIGIGVALSVLFVFSLLFLLYRYFNELKKNKKNLIMVIAVFFILSVLMLYFLSSNYVKFVQKRGIKPLPRGSVPFMEFFSDNMFIISMLLLFLSVFVLIAFFIYKYNSIKESYLIIALAWLMLSFYAVNAGPFYFKISPFRAWMLLAICVSIIAGEGIYIISSIGSSFAKSFIKNKILQSAVTFAVLAILFYFIITTSFVQKYAVNTSETWYPGWSFWTSWEEINGYAWIRDNLDKNSKLFSFTNNGPVLAMDMFTCHWCNEIRDYQQNGFNKSAEENYNWLKSNGYRYLVIDGQTSKRFKLNKTINKIEEVDKYDNFKRVFSNIKGVAPDAGILVGIAVFEVS